MSTFTTESLPGYPKTKNSVRELPIGMIVTFLSLKIVASTDSIALRPFLSALVHLISRFDML
jgi:hypothetical protein